MRESTLARRKMLLVDSTSETAFASCMASKRFNSTRSLLCASPRPELARKSSPLASAALEEEVVVVLLLLLLLLVPICCSTSMALESESDCCCSIIETNSVLASSLSQLRARATSPAKSRRAYSAAALVKPSCSSTCRRPKYCGRALPAEFDDATGTLDDDDESDRRVASINSKSCAEPVLSPAAAAAAAAAEAAAAAVSAVEARMAVEKKVSSAAWISAAFSSSSSQLTARSASWSFRLSASSHAVTEKPSVCSCCIASWCAASAAASAATDEARSVRSAVLWPLSPAAVKRRRSARGVMREKPLAIGRRRMVAVHDEVA